MNEPLVEGTVWLAAYITFMAFVLEVLWTLWTSSVSKQRPYVSGVLAAGIVYLATGLLKEWMHHGWVLHFYAAGTGLGCVATILWERSHAQSPKASKDLPPLECGARGHCPGGRGTQHRSPFPPPAEGNVGITGSRGSDWCI